MGQWREAWGEFLGTFILVGIGCGSVAAAVILGWLTSLWQVALVWGVGVSLAIYASKRLSQAHLNPAVTLAMWLSGSVRTSQVLPYLTGQMIGAFAAGAVLYLAMSGYISDFETAQGIVRGEESSRLSAMMFGEFYPNPGNAELSELNMWTAASWEMLGTFILVVMIFLLTRKGGNRYTPIFIGLTVSAIIMLVAPYTQAGLNPARDLSPRLVAWLSGWGDAAFPKDDLGFLVVYVLGPLVGAAVATVLAHVKALRRLSLS